ncbi:methyl-accepting chemotaxis protein [Cohnella xylanilytica]|uniref:Methyl-accepting chemotaxis protein n=1 Tax=Cohnella xylanilytica TaxID=557555 RepID=A0A841TRF1_9BACL|nr:methyl-accepting chemotaxis protein [Cohnella xylanilytica]MBB6690289.1 methyl-accepting chemotaxis protein [Cohnella xylanilytica]GIO11558.1 methyl-accepting chemotaxis protein [Cohnella xylanilytica]
MGSVRSKLLFSFLVVLLFTVGIGWNGIAKIEQVQTNSSEVTNKWMFGIETINTIAQLVEQYMGNYYQLELTSSADERKPLTTARDTLVRNIEQSLAQYEKTITDETDRSNYDSLTNNWGMFRKRFDLIAEAPEGSEEQTKATREAMMYFNNMRSLLKLMVMFDHNGAVQSTERSKEIYKNALAVFALWGTAALAAIGLIAFYLIRAITVPLKTATSALDRISDGDLTLKPLAVKRKDEFGTMMTAANRMLGRLQDSVNRMQQSSVAVAGSSKELSERAERNAEAAKQVAESIRQVSSGSDSQARYAAECSKVIDEMAEGVQRIAHNTSEVAELSKGAADSAGGGSEVIREVSRKMEGLSSSLAQTAQTIRRLASQTDRIGEISSLIGDIATRTNLLSLNAAIEAARAGEHGKGFAVVAGEVRKLAAQTEESSKSIIDLIHAIQRDTALVARTIGGNVEEARESVAAVRNAEEAFGVIAGSTAEVSARLQETAAAAEQLSASSEEVAASVETMGDLAVRTAGMAERVAAATEEQLASCEEIRRSSGELSGVADGMRQLAGQFRV